MWITYQKLMYKKHTTSPQRGIQKNSTQYVNNYPHQHYLLLLKKYLLNKE